MDPDLKNISTEELIELHKSAQDFIDFIGKEIQANQIDEVKKSNEEDEVSEKEDE